MGWKILASEGRRSVEVVGGGWGGVIAAGKGFDVGDVDGGLVAFGDLEPAMTEEEGLGGDGELVLLEGVAGDEEVGDAGFVFEGDEAVAFGGGRALAADDHAGDADRGAVAKVVKVGGRLRRSGK